jgi:hypothetical protein
MEIVYDHHWIRAIDHVLDAEFCEHLIDRFHACESQQHRRNDYPRLTELAIYNRDHRQLTAKELMRGALAWHDFTEDTHLLVDSVYSVAAAYREHWDHLHSFPSDFSMEGFRIKSYRAGSGDQFPIHSDAGCREMSTRFLALLFYLNDSDAGTEFPLENITIEAKQGRLLMFPPGMQWPHLGHEPRDRDKYILSTYLNFV